MKTNPWPSVALAGACVAAAALLPIGVLGALLSAYAVVILVGVSDEH
jgi:hypothetical protein